MGEVREKEERDMERGTLNNGRILVTYSLAGNIRHAARRREIKRLRCLAGIGTVMPASRRRRPDHYSRAWRRLGEDAFAWEWDERFLALLVEHHPAVIEVSPPCSVL